MAMTDKRPTQSSFDLLHKRPDFTVHRRNLKSIDTATICCTINATALSKVFIMDDVEAIHNVIVNEITTALDLVAPLKQVQLKERRTPLYLSAETRSAIRRRDAAAAGNYTEYRCLRNKAARLVRRDKLASNERHLQEQGYNPKAIWNLANTVSGRSIRSALPAELVDGDGIKVRGDASLADCVNKFYIDKINKIRKGIDENLSRCRGGCAQQQQQVQQRQQQEQPQTRFRFRAPTEKEVLAIIMSLNNTPATGIDGIPVVVLKHLAPIIAAPVAHLIKISFNSSLVPSAFKRASVVPLHKKNKPPNVASSYRPVAILDALSKVLEKVVLQQVSPHLAPLLPTSQFGFRPRRSTSAAIAYCHGSWTQARAKGLVLAVAGYDLSSAFDTIDVDMVSSKLQGLGVLQEENRWFSDYLSGRKQQVLYNASRSSFRNIEHGVPQGSILGPLLFLVLVSDLPNRILAAAGNEDVEVGISSYADDTLCWAAGKDAEQVGLRLEQVSAALVAYASENYLALNEQKTQVMWCPSKGRPLKVGSSMVMPSDKLEVLGVTFDKLLTANPHLLSLTSSAKTMAAMARRLSLHLPQNSLKTVISALLRGKIGYACSVLTPRFSAGDPTPSNMAHLQVCINNVARAVIRAKKCDKIRVEVLLEEAGLPSLNRLVIYTIAMECWRALSLRDVPNGPLNPLGSLLAPPNSDSTREKSTRTRAATSGCIPPPAKYQVSSFAWWGYTCWNSSPQLRAARTVSAARGPRKSWPRQPQSNCNVQRPP